MKKAFTLVELSIVLVIIGILMGMVVKGRSLIETAKLQSDIAKMRNMEIALSSFVAYNGGLPPFSEVDYGSGMGKYRSINMEMLVDSGFLGLNDLESAFNVRFGENGGFVYYFATESNISGSEGMINYDFANFNNNKAIVISYTIYDSLMANLDNPADVGVVSLTWKHFCKIKNIVDGSGSSVGTGRIRGFGDVVANRLVRYDPFLHDCYTLPPWVGDVNAILYYMTDIGFSYR